LFPRVSLYFFKNGIFYMRRPCQLEVRDEQRDMIGQCEYNENAVFCIKNAFLNQILGEFEKSERRNEQ
jgi:hypothetical protein